MKKNKSKKTNILKNISYQDAIKTIEKSIVLFSLILPFLSIKGKKRLILIGASSLLSQLSKAR